MGVKHTEIKNRTYYFYNDMINLENFESNLLKIEKKHYKNIYIYYVGYITVKKIADCENIYSVNPLYLLISGWRYLRKNGNKYQIFYYPVNGNKELVKKYTDVWNGIKSKIKAINSSKKIIKEKIT